MRLRPAILLALLLTATSSYGEAKITNTTRRVELGEPLGTVEVVTAWDEGLLRTITLKSSGKGLDQKFDQLDGVLDKQDFDKDSIKVFDLNKDGVKDLLIKTNQGHDLSSYHQFIFDLKTSNFTRLEEEIESPQVKDPSLVLSELGRWMMDEDFGYSLLAPGDNGLKERGELRITSRKSFPDYAEMLKEKTGVDVLKVVKEATKKVNSKDEPGYLVVIYRDMSEAKERICVRLMLKEKGKFVSGPMVLGDSKTCDDLLKRAESETGISYQEFLG